MQQRSQSHGRDDQEHRVLEDDDDPLNAGHHFQPGNGKRGDEEIPGGAGQENRPMIVDEGRRQQIERIDPRRNGQRGRAERVMMKHLGYPGISRAGTLVPPIQTLVGDGDAHHGHEADQNRHDTAVAADRDQSRQTHRKRLRRPRAGQPQNDGVAQADAVPRKC